MATDSAVTRLVAGAVTVSLGIAPSGALRRTSRLLERPLAAGRDPVMTAFMAASGRLGSVEVAGVEPRGF